MQLIALVQATPDSPEIAIVKLSGEENEDFRENSTKFVNENHIFRKPVKSVEIAPNTKKQVELTIIAHLPNCTCKAYGVG